MTAACNNGTTALVSREGEILLFGKDTTHCDNSTGLSLFYYLNFILYLLII